MDSTPQDQYLSADQAAAFLEISRPTFDRAVRCGALPRGFSLTDKPASHKRWSKKRLLEALEAKAA